LLEVVLQLFIVKVNLTSMSVLSFLIVRSWRSAFNYNDCNDSVDKVAYSWFLFS
jgi:hypothetical protein